MTGDEVGAAVIIIVLFVIAFGPAILISFMITSKNISKKIKGYKVFCIYASLWTIGFAFQIISGDLYSIFWLVVSSYGAYWSWTKASKISQ